MRDHEEFHFGVRDRESEREHDRCDCKHEEKKEDVCGICFVEEGFVEIRRALENTERGLREIRRCNFCEGTRRIERAIEEMERGVRKLEKGLRHIDLDERCSRRKIEEIIRHIRECIECIRKGLRAICRGDVRRGTCMIEKAVCEIKKDLCDLEKIIRLDENCCKCGR
ncbi:MAG: hypothetical protein FWC68_05585 [Oscillospiraceae bacterium]|nr:hypothetical protein [Oscillospiraceae bacterium]